tara:strand:+ start:1853 stop:2965 length:1113 start_codon:yes stop_codon:yes gene_type:complete
MSHEPYSLKGYEPIDSIEQDAPIGHGVQQNFGAETGHGKKASFWKGKGGRQYARRMDGRIITHDAEELGGDDASLADFSGVDSVVVEAPLGHGATQYYAEDEPEPQFNDGITGQDGPSNEPTNSHFCSECGHVKGSEDEPEPVFDDGITGQDGPETDPTNSNFSAQGYDDKQDESIGMRHRGRHSQSRKDRRDEASAMDRSGPNGRKYDDVATMDAEHNHWHDKGNGQFYGKWSKHKKNGQFSTHNSEYSQIMGPTVEANEGGLHSPSSFDITWEDGSGQSSASMPPNEIHFAETFNAEECSMCGGRMKSFPNADVGTYCPSCYGDVKNADFTLEKPVKTGFMVAFGAGLFSLAAIAGTVVVGSLLGGNQ